MGAPFPEGGGFANERATPARPSVWDQGPTFEEMPAMSGGHLGRMSVAYGLLIWRVDDAATNFVRP